MKKNGNLILLTLLFSTFAIPSIVSAGEGTELKGSEAFFTGGFPKSVIRDFDYWKSSSVSSYGYSSYVTNAVNKWDGISNADVSFNEVTSSGNADLRFYVGQYGLDYYGVMEPYAYDDTDGLLPVSTSKSWDMAKVKLNDETMQNISSSNCYETALHEVGHALGLRHQADGLSSTVMEITELRGRKDVGSLDIYNIQWKY